MDRLIKRFDSIRDADLRICKHRGVAYQRDMSAGRVNYDAHYLKKVQAYEGSDIAERVNVGRLAMVNRVMPWYGDEAEVRKILDWGAGSGAFMRKLDQFSFNGYGFEAIPQVVGELKRAKRFSDIPRDFDAVTMWDSIEHMEDPGVVLDNMRKGAHLFVSIPVFADLHDIRSSKHYRPGEHLYYWTEQGFIDYAALYGYRLMEVSNHEIEAGRENIRAFAFCRDLPDAQDYVKAYEEMHNTRYYGSSATELHLNTVAGVVKKLRPNSILDFGAGRSDLSAHFWLDGKRKICKYDPAIRTIRRLPSHGFDLVLVCDVMEHIPMTGVDKVLGQINGKAALFTISTKLARAKMPDGSNAHCTLLTNSEWTRWIESYFKTIQVLPSQWEHELILLAGK